MVFDVAKPDTTKSQTHVIPVIDTGLLKEELLLESSCLALQAPPVRVHGNLAFPSVPLGSCRSDILVGNEVSSKGQDIDSWMIKFR